MNKCFKQQTPRHKLDIWAHASGAVLISHQRPSRSCSPFLLPCTEPWCGSLWSGGATLLKLPNFSCPAGDDASYILRSWSLFRKRLLHQSFPPPPLPSASASPFLPSRPSWGAHALAQCPPSPLPLFLDPQPFSLLVLPLKFRKSHYSELPWWSSG